MGAAIAQLESAENAYAQEQADDPPARKRRDVAAADLSQRWADVRTQMVRRLGPISLREYGLEGEQPSNPDSLAKQATNAAKLLRPNPRSHTSKLGDFTTLAAAEHLEEAQAELAAALTVVTTETKELQDSLGRCDDAAANWTNNYQASATLLERLLRLGGRPELAERVRPTTRRATGLELNAPRPPTPCTHPLSGQPTAYQP
jgi:hypothetical protein